MSGPKVSALDVDWVELERARIAQEEQEKKELKALEKKVQREEREQKRLKRLQQKQEERRRRQEEKAEKERQLALKNYFQVRTRLESTLAARAGLQERFPELVLPPEPAIPERQNLSDASAVRKATMVLRQVEENYRKEADQALLEFHRQASIEGATTAMQRWIGQFRTRATHRAEDVISALEPDALFLVDRQRKRALESIAKRASKIIAVLGSKENIPEEVLEVLGNVLAQEDDSAAETALVRLTSSVREEQARRTVAKQEREKQERQKTLIQQREKIQSIAEQIADALENLGYDVSGVGETAFCRNGYLYACNSESPDHALRFEFDPQDYRVRAVPVRIMSEEEEQVIGKTDAEVMKEEDVEFDKAWCSASGVGKIRKEVGRRGVKVAFRTEHRPGDLDVPRVHEDELGEQLRKARSEEYEAFKKRERVRK